MAGGCFDNETNFSETHNAQKKEQNDGERKHLVQVLRELTVSGTAYWKRPHESANYRLAETRIGPIVIGIGPPSSDTTDYRVDIVLSSSAYQGYAGPEVEGLWKLVQTQISFNEPDKHKQLEELAQIHAKEHPGLDVAKDIKRMKRAILEAIDTLP